MAIKDRAGAGAAALQRVVRAGIAVCILTIGPWNAAAQTRDSFRVDRVVDGDTVILETIGRVRLIGVDTPESVHPRKPVQAFALEASAFLKKLLTGKGVRLEYDQTRKDRYRRTLAYLFLPDGTFVNEEIIRQGYGFAYTRYPFRYIERFRQREREARDRHVGLWATARN
jgi:micrococcal nuclease